MTSLAAVRSQLAELCAAAGRDVHELTLVAVTKTRPASDVATLARLGVYDVGESRDQEARAKLDELQAADASVAAELRWHFVGGLQSRKCRSVAGYASAVHSLDRSVLVPKLVEGLEEAGRGRLDVFVQVSLDGDPDRGGVAVDELDRLADEVAAQPALRLRGLMAVAPMHADPDVAFAQLAEHSQRLRVVHPEATAISAGMSGDLAAAIRHGSTHVRVGTALLGRRTPEFG